MITTAWVNTEGQLWSALGQEPFGQRKQSPAPYEACRAAENMYRRGSSGNSCDPGGILGVQLGENVGTQCDGTILEDLGIRCSLQGRAG